MVSPFLNFCLQKAFFYAGLIEISILRGKIQYNTMYCSGVKPTKSHSESANVCRRDVSTWPLSKLQYSGTVLVDQRLVVRLQLLNVRQLGGLGVQVKFAVEGRRMEGRLEVAIERQAVYLREREREREMLTWIPGPMAASPGPCHCTSSCSCCASATGRTNGSESCTSPAEREAPS